MPQIAGQTLTGQQVAVIGVLVVAWLSSLILFALSVSQTKEITSTATNQITLQSGGDPCNTPGNVFQVHRPWKMSLNGDPAFLQCDWERGHTAARAIGSILAFVGGAFALLLSWRRPIERLQAVSVALQVLFGLWLFIVWATDVARLRYAEAWCNGGTPGVAYNPPNTTIHCDYAAFNAVVFFGIWTAIWWFAAAGMSVSLYYRTK